MVTGERFPMVKALQNSTDPATGIPVVSLYGTKKKPSPEDLTGHRYYDL